MKPITIKSSFLIACLFIAFAGTAQNTSIGIPTGSYKKSDTTTSYTEDPQKHAHTQTIVIDKNKGKSEGEAKANGNGTSGSAGNNAPATDPSYTATSAPGETGYNGANTTESSTVTQMEDSCSCSSLHIAYGVAGVGILGMLIFLFLYINEKNKNRENRNP